MRTILLVQTLIIIAGGYYIYLISHPGEVTSPTVTEEVVVPDTTPATKKVGVSEAPKIATTSSSTTVTTDPQGPHDAGMEWPTLEGVQVQ